jgi:hypothetical protein
MLNRARERPGREPVTGQLAEHAEPAAPAGQGGPLPVAARPWRARRAGRVRAALWVAGGALAVFDLVVAQTAGLLDYPQFQVALLASCGAVAGGLLAWRQQPGSQVGSPAGWGQAQAHRRPW